MATRIRASGGLADGLLARRGRSSASMRKPAERQSAKRRQLQTLRAYVLGGAELDSNGRILVRLAHIAVERLEVEVQLAQVLGLEAIHLQLDRHQAVQPPVEEQQSSAKSRPPTWSGNSDPTKQKSRPNSMRKVRSWPSSPRCRSASLWSAGKPRNSSA